MMVLGSARTTTTPAVVVLVPHRTGCRRGYAIMDRYIKLNQTQPPQEADSSASPPAEETKKKKKGLSRVIPMHYLRAGLPAEAISDADYALDEEGIEGNVLEVSLLGAPNAGKSTLSNALVQSKVRLCTSGRCTPAHECTDLTLMGMTLACSGLGREPEGADDARARDWHHPRQRGQHPSGKADRHPVPVSCLAVFVCTGLTHATHTRSYPTLLALYPLVFERSTDSL